MLSSVGLPELVLLFVIGLLILGPERLPRVATQLGRWIGKARRTANQLRFQMEREIAMADIDRKRPPPKSQAKPEDKGNAAGQPGAAESGTAESGASESGATGSGPGESGAGANPVPGGTAAPPESAPADAPAATVPPDRDKNSGPGQ